MNAVQNLVQLPHDLGSLTSPGRLNKLIWFTFVIVYQYLVLTLYNTVVATLYGLDGPGIESRWRRDIPQPSRLALAPTQPPMSWVPSHSGHKAVGAWSWPPTPVWHWDQRKSRAIRVLSLWAFMACSRANLKYRDYYRNNKTHFCLRHDGVCGS